ncbi:MAG: transposase [Coriobacteriia bacterium]|nr:transposase [Coriobacteriia bacterium]
MSRTGREKSASGIYHVMIRGINHQQIFEDDEDNLMMLECLQACKTICDFKLYAYCLMGNHLHLLVEAKNDNLADIFRRLGTRFVYWYNGKYQRSGHLFQDRYMSEPVDTDAYFLTALRYIHLNPVKIKICSDPADYRFSSYRAYLNDNDDEGMVDTSFALEMIGRDEFVRYHHEDNDDVCLEFEIHNRMTDADALNVIETIAGYKNPSIFQALAREERNEVLRKLKAEGLSIRRISRLTGIGKTIVERA